MTIRPRRFVVPWFSPDSHQPRHRRGALAASAGLASLLGLLIVCVQVTTARLQAQPAQPAPAQGQSQSVPVTPLVAEQQGVNQTVKDVVDIGEKVLRILAVLIGGAFAYFKFFKERLSRPRLELKMSGSQSWTALTGT